MVREELDLKKQILFNKNEFFESKFGLRINFKTQNYSKKSIFETKIDHTYIFSLKINLDIDF